MDTEECIRTRRSIRKFLSTPLDMDVIGRIIEAGRLSPTAGNLQNYKIVLVRNKGRIKKIAEASMQQFWIETAPVVLVVVSEPQRARQFYGKKGEKEYSVMNCAIISENICLAAHNNGIGSCMVGSFEQNMMRNAINAPDYVEPMMVIPLGYPDEKVPIPERYKLHDIVFIETFGSHIEDIDKVTRMWSPTVKRMAEDAKTSLAKGTKSLIEVMKDKTIKINKEMKKKISGMKERIKKNKE